ncbi:MAG: LysM peptidoglycan-binding domain-containing protein [Gallionella sp.]
MRKIISLICFLLPVLASADQLQIRPDAPDRHVVVKGDTLWDISEKFFQDPWKWPYIWGLNKNTIKDPHWIYPGDVVLLDRDSGTLHIDQMAADDQVTAREPRDALRSSDASDGVRLSPRIREDVSDHDAIPSIPFAAIAPFLSRPLVIEKGMLSSAPSLIGAREGRVILGAGDICFAKGLTSDLGNQWQIYRPGKKFIDPDSDEVLGIEAVYLGNAEVTNFAEISTVSITHSIQEVYQGDRLVAPSAETAATYLPRAPENKISARVISVYGGVTQAGQNMIITLNKGAREGVEIGHVLALYHKGEIVKSAGDSYTLPDQRYGLAFVFRVFDKVSYALVMETKLPVQLLDIAQNP